MITQRIYLLLFASLFTCGLHAQKSVAYRNDAQGTAIFYDWLDDRFIVATDSLSVNFNTRKVIYNDCKIVVQGTRNDFVTVSGGTRTVDVAFHKDNGYLKWNSQELATEAFKFVSTANGTKEPRQVAQRWREMALGKLNRLSLMDREAAQRFVGGNKMLFVGLTGNGQIDAWTALLGFQGGLFTIDVEKAFTNKISSLALGNDIANEFALRQTDRSRRENTQFESTLPRPISREEYKARAVIQIVKWVIKYPPKNKDGVVLVGGIPEAVELRPHSGLTWREPCPANAMAFPK
jgi:hypothetical protein